MTFVFGIINWENVLSGAGRKVRFYATNEELPRQIFNKASVYSITQDWSSNKTKNTKQNVFSTSTNASSPLTNGAPPRRWSRPGVILSRCPRTQILRFVPINPLLFDYLSPEYLGFEILMGLVFWTLITCFGMGFAVFWYLGAFWLDSKVVKFNPKQIWFVYYENLVFLFQLILFGFQIMGFF